MGKWGGVKNFTLNGEMGGVKDFTLNGEMGGGQRLYSKWGNGGSTPQFSFIPKVTFFLGLA